MSRCAPLPLTESSPLLSVVVDIVDDKLKFAQEFAATSTFKPSPPKEGEGKTESAERNAQELINSIQPLTQGADNDVARNGGFDLVMECTGAPPCIQMGMFAAKPRARFVQVGMGANDVTIPIHKLGVKELEMTGVSTSNPFPQDEVTDVKNAFLPSPSAMALAPMRRPSTSSHQESFPSPRSSHTGTPLRTAPRHSKRLLKVKARMARVSSRCRSARARHRNRK